MKDANRKAMFAKMGKRRIELERRDRMDDIIIENSLIPSARKKYRALRKKGFSSHRAIEVTTELLT